MHINTEMGIIHKTDLSMNIFWSLARYRPIPINSETFQFTYWCNFWLWWVCISFPERNHRRVQWLRSCPALRTEDLKLWGLGIRSVGTARPRHGSHITNVIDVFLDDLALYWPSWSLHRLAARQKGKEIPGLSQTRVGFTKLIVKQLSPLEKRRTQHKRICQRAREWVSGFLFLRGSFTTQLSQLSNGKHCIKIWAQMCSLMRYFSFKEMYSGMTALKL